MRRIRGIFLALAVGLMMQSAVGVVGLRTSTIVRAAGKSGLRKSGKNYYYYSKGKKIKNKWKTVGKYRYYFGKKGAACKGLTSINGKRYYFDKNCRMKKKYWYKGTYYFNSKGQAVTGLQCIKKNYTYKLYCFGTDGKLNKQKQAVLNQYNEDKMYQKPITSLLAIIGQPIRIDYPEDIGCAGVGRDVVLQYAGFRVLGNEDNGVIYFQAFER